MGRLPAVCGMALGLSVDLGTSEPLVIGLCDRVHLSLLELHHYGPSLPFPGRGCAPEKKGKVNLLVSQGNFEKNQSTCNFLYYTSFLCNRNYDRIRLILFRVSFITGLEKVSNNERPALRKFHPDTRSTCTQHRGLSGLGIVEAGVLWLHSRHQGSLVHMC